MNDQPATEPTLQELSYHMQEQQRQLAELQQRLIAPRPQVRSHFPWWRRPGLMSVALIGLLITISGLAAASVPAATGVITGCADGDQYPAPVAVTEPTTITSGAQTMFLPIVTQ